MPITVEVSTLRALGFDDATILKIAEAAEKEAAVKRREQTRIRVQNHRSRNAGNGYKRYKRYPSVENKEQSNDGTEDATRARGSDTLFPSLLPSSITKSLQRGSRLPADWRVPDSDHTWALQQGLSNDEIAALTDEFRDHWKGVAGAKGIKLDWPATWRNRVRYILNSPRRMARPGKPQGSYAKHFAALQAFNREREQRGWG